MNISHLKELCSIHSVSGDTDTAVISLEQQLKKKGITTQISDFGILLFGNLKDPQLVVTAHIDEVGFQVVKKLPNNTFLVNKCGHVSPTMLNNSHVYVQTTEGQINGTFFSNLELGHNSPESFDQVFLDVTEPDKVQVGDFGSYQRVFHTSNEKIIATGLDNKISVHMILEMIEEKPELLMRVLFAFVTEEETTYDCISGLSKLYSPHYGIVVDMCPSNQRPKSAAEILPENGKGGAILFAFNKYKLHPELRKQILPKLKTPYQKVFLDIDFPPEAQMLQSNGYTKAVIVFIPMMGWHNVAYSMEIRDYELSKKTVLELIGLIKD